MKSKFIFSSFNNYNIGSISVCYWYFTVFYHLIMKWEGTVLCSWASLLSPRSVHILGKNGIGGGTVSSLPYQWASQATKGNPKMFSWATDIPKQGSKSPACPLSMLMKAQCGFTSLSPYYSELPNCLGSFSPQIVSCTAFNINVGWLCGDVFYSYF